MASAIVVILLVGGVAALIGYVIYTAIAQRNIQVSLKEELPFTPEESVQRLQAIATPMLQRWKYRVTNQGMTNVQFSYTYRPGWLLIPCLLFFPIGLLSLIHKKTVDLNVNAFPSVKGTDLSIVGVGSPPIRDHLDVILKELAGHQDAERPR